MLEGRRCIHILGSFNEVVLFYFQTLDIADGVVRQRSNNLLASESHVYHVTQSISGSVSVGIVWHCLDLW